MVAITSELTDHAWVTSRTLRFVYRTDSTSTSASASSTGSASTDNRPPNDKIIGISLAVASGLFIGTSFVLKKRGLLNANEKYHEEAGEGYGYLKNAFWWTGMTLMIVGELCNFVAYAFTDAIIVTPMGALSVVVCAILSAIFLKERLSFVGKVACLICILGSVVIPLNAPERAAVKDIQEMQHYVIAPGFLSYAGIIILGCIFTAFWAGPRYGKRSMLVYLTICSLIGGLSVVATQGLGSAIIAQTRGEQQFNQWFLYVLFFFVIGTLLTEIVYLNVSTTLADIVSWLTFLQKALNIFNAAMVTPTYYVYFTSATIATSAILFQGLGGTPVQIITIVLGFLTICSGVVLLQMSNSAKDVPDAAIFSGDLDQMRTIAEQEQPESEPKADTFRGTAGLLRSISKSRRRMEHEEARRIIEDKKRDQLDPIGEDEMFEWDGLRRRKTVIQPGKQLTIRRQDTHKNVHPPLGMSHFPNPQEDVSLRPTSSSGGAAFGFGFRRKTRRNVASQHGIVEQLDDFNMSPSVIQTKDKSENSSKLDHVYGLPHDLKPMNQHDGTAEGHRKPIDWASEMGEESQSLGQNSNSVVSSPSPVTGRRAFSFQNPLHRNRGADSQAKTSASRNSSRSFATPMMKDSTEEERLGLVKNISHKQATEDYEDMDDDDLDEYDIKYSHRVDTGVPTAGEYDSHNFTEEHNTAAKDWTRSQLKISQGRPLPRTPNENDEGNENFGGRSRQSPTHMSSIENAGNDGTGSGHFL